jgi:murein DD-endopeptidase MepM/ murein hydrolase activator NlpD
MRNNREMTVYRAHFKAFALIIFLTAALLPADSMAAYPHIEILHRDDPVFRQATDDISLYYRAVHTDKNPPPLTLFSYSAKEGDTLFSIAARFNLPYETIALLNGLRNPEALQPGNQLLIPNTPGLFIAGTPQNDIEKLILSWRTQASETGTPVYIIDDSAKKLYYFIQGERFHPLERLFFLNVLFRFPLPQGVVSSRYGERTSPFTHERHFHHGIDIAAPYGTEVQAARGGIAVAVGNDALLGNYVVLQHEGNFTTIYGHLEKSFVRAGQKINAGAIIGSVGSTGMSTGPHLHFEIRNAGESWDPLKLLS